MPEERAAPETGAHRTEEEQKQDRKGKNMTIVITDNCVNDTAAYLPLAKAFVEDAGNDKGCHGMKICTDPERPDHVVFLSRWDSREDFMAHVQGPSFAKHIPGMSPYYVSGTDTFLEEVQETL